MGYIESEKSAIWMLKRRFWKDKGKSDAFAKQELRRQDRRKVKYLFYVFLYH